MARIVYSLYIDIPKESRDQCVAFQWGPLNGVAQRLINGHTDYARSCGADYRFFDGRTEEFLRFSDMISSFNVSFTPYERINFFKLYLLEELSRRYDELLYLDFDVIPVRSESVFDSHNLEKGIHLKSQTAAALESIDNQDGMEAFASSRLVSKRSTASKYINCHAMLKAAGIDATHDVVNTGIIAASRDCVRDLNYFGESFSRAIQLMVSLKSNDQRFVQLRRCFAYDNETILSYYLASQCVNWVELESRFHFICKQQIAIPNDAVLVHAIHKDFDHVWRQASA
jgi:hypothetical protein